MDNETTAQDLTKITGTLVRPEPEQAETEIARVTVCVMAPALPRLRNGPRVGASRDLSEARARQAERLATEASRRQRAEAIRDAIVDASHKAAGGHNVHVEVTTHDPWNGRRKAVT